MIKVMMAQKIPNAVAYSNAVRNSLLQKCNVHMTYAKDETNRISYEKSRKACHDDCKDDLQYADRNEALGHWNDVRSLHRYSLLSST